MEVLCPPFLLKRKNKLFEVRINPKFLKKLSKIGSRGMSPCGVVFGAYKSVSVRSREVLRSVTALRSWEIGCSWLVRRFFFCGECWWFRWGLACIAGIAYVRAEVPCRRFFFRVFPERPRLCLGLCVRRFSWSIVWESFGGPIAFRFLICGRLVPLGVLRDVKVRP